MSAAIAKRRRRTQVNHPICPLHRIKMPTSRVVGDWRYHYCTVPDCPSPGRKTFRTEAPQPKTDDEIRDVIFDLLSKNGQLSISAIYHKMSPRIKSEKIRRLLGHSWFLLIKKTRGAYARIAKNNEK